MYPLTFEIFLICTQRKNICHKKNVFKEGQIILQPLQHKIFILQIYYKRLLQLENTKLNLRLDLPI